MAKYSDVLLNKYAKRDPKVNRVLSLYNVEEKAYEYNPYGIPEDFRDFARLCKVRSGVDFVPFELFDYQEEISDLIDNCRGIAALKTRQVGFSEVCSCKMLHRSLLSPAYLGVAFSLGQEEASKLSDRVGVMPAFIDDFTWAIDSKRARKSDKGGELLFRPSTPNSARSLASVTDLFFDECGFPPDIEEMYGNATPAQSMVGDKARRILGTTIPPEGLNCWFGLTFWNKCEFDLEEEIERVKEGRGRNGKGFSYWIDDDGWARILLHWQSHPIYSLVPDRLAKVKAAEKLTEDQLQREHNLGIPKQGGILFNLDALKRNQRNVPVDSLEYKECLKIWHQPKRNHHYVIGTDPNGGGSNNYVTQVWDITAVPFKLAAEYAECQQSVTHSVDVTADLILRYEPECALIESNFGGVVIAETLRAKCPDLMERISAVTTSNTSKRVNTDRIAYELESDVYEFPEDWEGVAEAKRFSALNREAIDGNDDRIMAWAVSFAKIEEVLENLSVSPDWIGAI